jgi:uncharacterized protein (TIGR00156 family)
MRNAKPLVFVSLLLAGSAAYAQSAVPAQAASLAPAASSVRAGGYAGPSAVAHHGSATTASPKTTIQQLLAQGHDDQHATISGKIVRHLGGHRYMLADATGELQLEIAPKHFPAGVTIDEKTEVVVSGEFEKKHHGKPELEVKRIELIAP